jgi:hypothetical protein
MLKEILQAHNYAYAIAGISHKQAFNCCPGSKFDFPQHSEPQQM